MNENAIKLQLMTLCMALKQQPDEAGWAEISRELYPRLAKDVSGEIAEFKVRDGKGYVRLTAQGMEKLETLDFLDL